MNVQSFCFGNDLFDTGNLKGPNHCPAFTKMFGAMVLAEHQHNPIILSAPKSYYLEF